MTDIAADNTQGELQFDLMLTLIDKIYDDRKNS